MTVQIHIPSSDAPDAGPSPGIGRPQPRRSSLVVAGLLAVVVSVSVVISVVSASDEPTTDVPAPFETVAETAEPTRSERWTGRSMPGTGEVLAMGTAANAMLAVTVDGPGPLVWELTDGVWQVVGEMDLDWIGSALVGDNRVLVSGELADRPAVWEWVDGTLRFLFRPTSGVITGVWSVGGRLVVVTAESSSGTEAALRYGRSDSLWVESTGGAFDEASLVGLATVLSVDAVDGLIAVGGIDADGRAALGFLHDGRVLADPVPRGGEQSGVTDLDLRSDSVVALVTVVDRGPRSEVRVGVWSTDITGEPRWDGELPTVLESSELVGVEVVGDSVYGATISGDVMSVGLDGAPRGAVSAPAWPYGHIRGMGTLGDDLVLYGRSEGHPYYVGPSAGEATVVLPAGGWERYHTQEASGFDLVAIGSLEFATRDGELFVRSWNGERWHRADTGGLVLFGRPTILQLAWGLVLVPGSGPGLWWSDDGSRWDPIPGAETVRVHEAATDGETFLGVTHLGSTGGPSSDVTVVGRSGLLERISLPYQLVGLLFERGVGFAATVAPPETGFAASGNGIEWVVHDGGGRFEWVVGLQGALYWGSGEPVTPDVPVAEVPGTGEGWLFSPDDGVLVWQSVSGDTWLYVGSSWEPVGFGVVDGLPAVPHRLVVRDRSVFAMVETADGVAESYALDFD